MDKLKAYIGLELAMSIVKIGGIRNYWEKARFTGHSDFPDIMSWNAFQAIHGMYSIYKMKDYSRSSRFIKSCGIQQKCYHHLETSSKYNLQCNLGV